MNLPIIIRQQKQKLPPFRQFWKHLLYARLPFFFFFLFSFWYHVQPVVMIYFIHGYSFSSSSFFLGGGGGVGGVSCRTCCDHLLYPRLLSFYLSFFSFLFCTMYNWMWSFTSSNVTLFCFGYYVQPAVIIYLTCAPLSFQGGGGGGGIKMNYLSRICSLIISFLLFLRSNPHLQCVGPGVQPAHTWTSS